MSSYEKVALITGAGSGIGRSVTLALSREGYAVVLAGRRGGPLEETTTAAQSTGGRTLIVPVDITDPAAVRALFAKTNGHPDDIPGYPEEDNLVISPCSYRA